MKQPLFLFAFLLLPFLCFSQGVTFQQGSWKDALVLAKQTNKPVCLYLYSSKSDERASFLKQSTDDLFHRETVGDVYNAYFVNVRIDTESKEGLELLRRYRVTNPLTLLFVNADGTLLSRTGLMGANDLVDGAKKVLLDVKSPKPITAWAAEYPQKKQDPAFLMDFLMKQRELGLPINATFDQYLRLLPQTDPVPVSVAKLFEQESSQLMVTDYAYRYFMTHRKAYDASISSVYQQMPEENDLYFQNVVLNTVKEAVLHNDETLLKKAVAAFRQIPSHSDLMHVEEIYMDYYKQTNELDKYLVHARLYVEEHMRKLDSESLLMKGLSAQERSTICSELNSIVWYIFQHFAEPRILKKALEWSGKTTQLYPKSAHYLDTHANLLYKLGRKQEAIEVQKQAIANYSGSTGVSVFHETLKKMEAGEKTW